MMNFNTHKFLERLALTIVFCTIVGLFSYVAYRYNEYVSPAHQAIKALADGQSKIREVLFAPDDNVQDLLITLINEEKESISVAAYSFTDQDIAQALINAQNRGVRVEVVVDGSSSITAYHKASFLAKHRIPLWVYPSVKTEGKQKRPKGIMHNKFMIFKNSLLNRSIIWTGSFNFTRSAQNINQENVIVLDDPHFVEKYTKRFDILKQRSIKQN